MAGVTAQIKAVVTPSRGGWLAAAASRTGSRRRIDEDAWTIVPAGAGPADGWHRPLLLAVADGVGGEAAGEEASAAAVGALADAWRAWRPAQPPSAEEAGAALLAAARAADNAVSHLASTQPHAHGAATTLTAVAVGPDFLAIVHAGDSRAYRLQAATATQLTSDHTWLAEHPEPGTATHPMRHVITRFLGQPGGCPFEALTASRQPGDGLLLCTDGVTNVVASGELIALEPAGDPTGAGATGATGEPAAPPAPAGDGSATHRNAAESVERLLGIVAARSGADDATAVIAWPGLMGDDPFGLGRLLEREPAAPGAGQRRRSTLTRGAALAVAALGLAGGAGFWFGPRLADALRRPFRTPPGPPAGAYLQTWAAGSYGALYERLTPEIRRTIDRAGFVQQHEAFAATLTLKGLTLTPRSVPDGEPASGELTGVPFEAIYDTARFGELRRQNTLPLAWRDGDWRIAWSPAVLLPELTAGRTLRSFSDPAPRGALLDRKGQPLATDGSGPVARHYPEGELIGSLTGYLGEVTAEELTTRAKDGVVAGDRIGKAGLEAANDPLLAGKPGARLTVNAPSGEIASTLSAVPPVPGESVRLTLDLDVQRECVAALGQRRGSVVVVDVQEGTIQGLASYPRYDPNVFASGGDVGAILNDPGQPLIDRPVQGLYPAGSIFKAVTMAAALEQGAFKPDSQFTCNGRWTELPGLTFDCWLRTGHGRLDLVSGLTQSCNCVFYQVGKRLNEIDPNYLPDFAARSGFGVATGAVPGLEPVGTVPSPQWKRQTLNDGWAPGDAVNMAIGQGQLLVTPLQVAALYAAIAAGGQRRGPRLLDRAFLPGGNVERLLTPPAKPALPWSGATLEAVRTGLRNVVGASYGTAAFVFQGSPLATNTAGKTGTAESGPGRNPHAWFAAYSPLETPRVLVLAMLEQAGEGSQVAAPLVRGLLQRLLGT